MSDQRPEEYFVIRVDLVAVKKGVLGYREKPLKHIAVIPDSDPKVAELWKRIAKLCGEYGVEIGPVEAVA